MTDCTCQQNAACHFDWICTLLLLVWSARGDEHRHSQSVQHLDLTQRTQSWRRSVTCCGSETKAAACMKGKSHVHAPQHKRNHGASILPVLLLLLVQHLDLKQADALNQSSMYIVSTGHSYNVCSSLCGGMTCLPLPVSMRLLARNKNAR